MPAHRKYFYQDFTPIAGDPKRQYVSPSTGEVLSRYQFESLARGETYYKVRLRNRYLGAPPPPPKPAPQPKPISSKKTLSGGVRKKSYSHADYVRRHKAAQITWTEQVNEELEQAGFDPVTPDGAMDMRGSEFERYYHQMTESEPGSDAFYEAVEALGFDDEVEYYPDGDTP